MRRDQRLLTDDDLAALRETGHRARYGAGTLIVSHGDTSDFVLVVDEGWIKAVRRVASNRRKPEAPRIVALHGPGGIVGEIAAVTGRPRIADLIAMTEVHGTLVSGPDWLTFLESRPGTLIRLYRRAESIRADYADLRAESATNSFDKIATALVDIVETGLGTPGDEPSSLRITGFSQTDVAGLAGVSRESAGLALKDLRDRGVIRTGRERFTIVDVDGLYRFAARERPPRKETKMPLALIDAVPIVIALLTISGVFRYLTSRNDNTTLMKLATFVGPERTAEMIRHFRRPDGVAHEIEPAPCVHDRGDTDPAE